ncbi:MAG: glycosyltransferase family 2 protein [Dethiobacter sp.]|nr:glycosyltransferase family 2 protein [Dethiobacter sp.]
MTVALSVAIPTYNGSCHIREALESIIIQLEDIDEEVEIVISDNASTDGTPEIIREYQQKYPFIKYFRNDENLGVDRNFDLAVQRASGKYVWLFGDDDKMAPGGVQKVLSVLGANLDIANIFVNCTMMNAGFDHCHQERVIKIHEDLLLRADDFLLLAGATAALVPSMIVQRRLWLEVDKTRFLDTGWLALGTLFLMIPGHVAYCISTPYSLFRDGSSRWHKDGKFLRMIFSLCDIIESFVKCGYTRTAVDTTIKGLTNNPTLLIFSARQHGLVVNYRLLSEACKKFGRSPYFWFLGMPLLLLPKNTHQLVWKVYQIPLVKRVYKKGKSRIWKRRQVV